MNASINHLVASLALLSIVTLGVYGDEEKVALDKLPSAVVKAVKAKFPKAKLVSAGKEVEGGQTVYEVQIKNNGQTIEVTTTPKGKILEVEKEIAVKDLPKAVKAALDAMYPKAEVKKVEEIHEGDKPAVFELLVVTAKKKTVEVKFDAKGKVVNVEEKKKGDD